MKGKSGPMAERCYAIVRKGRTYIEKGWTKRAGLELSGIDHWKRRGSPREREVTIKSEGSGPLVERSGQANAREKQSVILRNELQYLVICRLCSSWKDYILDND